MKEDEWLEMAIENGDLLDVTKDYPIYHTLSINGVPFAPLGGLHGMTGQPGHGKTMTLSMVAAAVLGDKTHGIEWLLGETIPNPRVLYIDTEMERGNTQRVNMRICAMLGWDWHTPHEQLTIMCLREVTKAMDRWRKVLKGIYMYHPNVVILDGLIDVVADFNDNTDCQELISKCMATASHYNISFWALLHENPGSEKMVGHAGSFLERKASDVMVTRKKIDDMTGDVTFEIKSKKVRAKDWDGYSFKVDDSKFKFGVPRLIGAKDPVLIIARCLKANLHRLGETTSRSKIANALGGRDKDEKVQLAIDRGFVTEDTETKQRGGGHPCTLNIETIDEYIKENPEENF